MPHMSEVVVSMKCVICLCLLFAPAIVPKTQEDSKGGFSEM